jgi:hemoglobin-like flavoprotein
LIPSNIRLERASQRPRISGFRFLNIGPSTGMWGTFLVNHETCTYLTPEQFDGCPRSKATDQYALGLIGYELLSGRPIDRVTRPADFVHRPEFFLRLERTGDWVARAPALAGIVLRMLRVDPAQRWKSMAEVAEVLDAVVVEDSVEAAARHRVLASYITFQPSDLATMLYEKFYRHLFERAPDVEQLFANRDMFHQYNALNLALKALLDYGSDPQSAEAIRAVAVKHMQLGLTERHLDAFERAFLAALQDTGVREPETLEAWRQVLAPGLQQMRVGLRNQAAAQPAPALPR